MNTIETTDRIALAAKFVNNTSSHIFLTGKAGTGKTTFLQKLCRATHKKFVVVAPTGIAALNAKGVTIHSQFLLPLGTFLPDNTPSGDFGSDTGIYTQFTLARKHPLNSMRRQVLRDIDLLIIDEVSMLRADLLDAIDYRMRSVKRNFRKSFGGVQVLMVGDLYQLPPVVKEQEMNYLKKYYASPHFFEAKALREDGYVYLELDKIFRQQNETFIRILNNLRNNACTPDDIEELNRHYRTPGQVIDEEGLITLTTHNYKADQLNKQALGKLLGKVHAFKADIEDDFPEFLFPVQETIELKSGAQIMFVKNDTSDGAYYNGKLAIVTSIDAGNNVEVEMEGSKEKYILKREIWENKKYTVNPVTRELDEEITGRFRQFPIRLAWAITVHKSQGLTFEKAVIDVGQAFAPGQVYVALSRLRSLEGLILRTRIDTQVIATDEQVVKFSCQHLLQDDLDERLQKNERNYLRAQLEGTFDFSEVAIEIDKIRKGEGSSMEFEDESMRSALQTIAAAIAKETNNTSVFKKQLLQLLDQGDHEQMTERISRGSMYYQSFINEQTKKLLVHIEEIRRYSRTKKYVNALEELDLLFSKKSGDIGKLNYIAQQILSGAEIEFREEQDTKKKEERERIISEVQHQTAALPLVALNKSGRKRKTKEQSTKNAKLPKGASNKETYTLHASGMSVAEIAGHRNLSVGTIETHIAKGILDGEVKIETVFRKEELDEILTFLGSRKVTGMTEIVKGLNDKFSYNQVRMAQNYLIMNRANEDSV
ncbi:MAG: AAA family ATPase [Crocinitomicaceae bacterium]|nr:AAA family ATPase [Crocinitomicaceae bacterium]